jgi:hypothetical protein
LAYSKVLASISYFEKWQDVFLQKQQPGGWIPTYIGMNDDGRKKI